MADDSKITYTDEDEPDGLMVENRSNISIILIKPLWIKLLFMWKTFPWDKDIKLTPLNDEQLEEHLKKDKERKNMKEKNLYNSDVSIAKKNVPDIKVFGNGDMFQLLCKASSESEGWMKSTKAMEVGNGCIVQITTQQRNPDGSYAVAEAVCFVPDVAVYPDENGGRKLMHNSYERMIAKKQANV